MSNYRLRLVVCAVMAGALVVCWQTGHAEPPPSSRDRVVSAIANIKALIRPGQDALAAIWDGNKYIQCRRMTEDTLRCEAAGTVMQPSLGHVLVPERVGRLAALGWRLDTSFGNYVQTFASDMPAGEVADRLMQALAEGYDADLIALDIRTDWIRSEPCPPRNGPSQNLAGMINDARPMAKTAIHACSFSPDPDQQPGTEVNSTAELIKTYGKMVTGEVQRLRVNTSRRVFFALETGAGYVQCEAQSQPQAFYCEAQSADSWPVLARILTTERVARLHAVGFVDPGRSPNYSKTYPADDFADAVIADELLALLYEVYSYNGVPKLKIMTEKGRY